MRWQRHDAVSTDFFDRWDVEIDPLSRQERKGLGRVDRLPARTLIAGEHGTIGHVDCDSSYRRCELTKVRDGGDVPQPLGRRIFLICLICLGGVIVRAGRACHSVLISSGEAGRGEKALEK